MKAVPQLLMAHSPRHKKPNTESLSETRTGFFFGRVVIYLQRTAVQDPRVLLYLSRLVPRLRHHWRRTHPRSCRLYLNNQILILAEHAASRCPLSSAHCRGWQSVTKWPEASFTGSANTSV